jgi:hypothetical protein
MIVVIAAGAWCLASVVTALAAGRVLRRRSQARNRQARPGRQCWGCGAARPEDDSDQHHREGCPAT